VQGFVNATYYANCSQIVGHTGSELLYREPPDESRSEEAASTAGYYTSVQAAQLAFDACHYYTHSVWYMLELFQDAEILTWDGSTDGGCTTVAQLTQNDEGGVCPTMDRATTLDCEVVPVYVAAMPITSMTILAGFLFGLITVAFCAGLTVLKKVETEELKWVFQRGIISDIKVERFADSEYLKRNRWLARLMRRLGLLGVMGANVDRAEQARHRAQAARDAQRAKEVQQEKKREKEDKRRIALGLPPKYAGYAYVDEEANGDEVVVINVDSERIEREVKQGLLDQIFDERSSQFLNLDDDDEQTGLLSAEELWVVEDEEEPDSVSAEKSQTSEGHPTHQNNEKKKRRKNKGGEEDEEEPLEVVGTPGQKKKGKKKKRRGESSQEELEEEAPEEDEELQDTAASGSSKWTKAKILKSVLKVTGDVKKTKSVRITEDPDEEDLLKVLKTRSGQDPDEEDLLKVLKTRSGQDPDAEDLLKVLKTSSERSNPASGQAEEEELARLLRGLSGEG